MLLKTAAFVTKVGSDGTVAIRRGSSVDSSWTIAKQALC